MWSHPIGRVRLLGMVEAMSFLLLLGVAMPLKYAADMPIAVTIVGMAHGLLFIGLCYATVLAMSELKWPWTRGAMVVGASLIPFGPFVIDGRLKREQSGS